MNLRLFFTVGRKPWGGYMGETEDLHNAIERNLSCCSEDVLKSLVASADSFAMMCLDELRSRSETDDVVEVEEGEEVE